MGLPVASAIICIQALSLVTPPLPTTIDLTVDYLRPGLSRDSFAEARVVRELQAINKPFVVVLNCQSPKSPAAKALRAELEER